MKTVSNQSVLKRILLWWAAWVLITMSLTNGWDRLPRSLIRTIPLLIGITVLLSVNLKYLLPTFFFQKKQTLYIVLSALLIVMIGFLLTLDIFPWSNKILRPKRSGLRLLSQMMPFIITLLGSTLIEITRFANRKETQAIQSDKEKLESELKFLKSQVNPHFLFNALNNIYSLAVTQAPETPESVMQLSEILRYMVYDSNESKVPLKNEINYIENFVDLQLLKDSRSMDVKVLLDKSAPDLMIAPMMFIPFVENAFKHSKIENLKESYIRINLEIDGKEIKFHAINSIPNTKFTKDKVGGVGLKNIKKQLEMLYPNGQHDLKINETTEQFEVILKIMV